MSLDEQSPDYQRYGHALYMSDLERAVDLAFMSDLRAYLKAGKVLRAGNFNKFKRQSRDDLEEARARARLDELFGPEPAVDPFS